MEGFLGELKEWCSLFSAFGVGITIFLLVWRFPSKAYVNRGDDNLQRQINQGIDLTLTVTKGIREDMRQMRSEKAELMRQFFEEMRQMRSEKAEFMRGFSEEMRQMRSENAELTEKFHTENAKLTDTLHVEIGKVTNTLHTEIAKLSDKIDEKTSEVRSEIRELNKDYKAHLLQHAEKK